MGHLDAGWSPSQPFLLQVCLNFHVSPFAQPQGVLKWMQISVPADVCVMLSDAGPSLEAMLALEGQKEWSPMRWHDCLSLCWQALVRSTVLVVTASSHFLFFFCYLPKTILGRLLQGTR